MNSRKFSASALAVLLCGTAMPVVAQDSAPEGGLDQILVTAERREQNLQDVPVSATVLSGEQLTQRGVVTLNDIQQVAPSIAINTFNRSTYINIRGVGIAQSAPTSNPGVAYYIDGQLIPHEQFIGHSFYDIGTIEVLRGPQGTLSGQNSTGGAIYVRSPAPQFDTTSFGGDFTVGNYNRYRAVLTANIGAENVALRLAYVHDERDSFTDNIAANAQSQPGNMNLDAVRANLALQTSDGRGTINLRGEWFDMQSDNNAVKRRGDTVSTDPFEIQEDALSFLNQRGYRLSAEVNYEMSDSVGARALVSFQDGYTRDQTDGDRTATAVGVPANLPTSGANTRTFPGRVSIGDTVFETFIAEFNLLSLGTGPLQWVVGAFMLDEDVPVTLLRDNRNTTDFVVSNSDIIAEAVNTSYSVFGQANYFLNDNLEVLVGGRYSWDKQVYTRFAVPGPPVALPLTSAATSEKLTGKLGLNYHFDNNGMVYVSASRGYKAGGVNLTPNTPDFLPEQNTVYEAGFKTEILDRHLRLNGAVFMSEYEDIQLSSLVGGLPVTQNALAGESIGAELEATAQFGGFQANFGVGYLDATFSNSACISDTNLPGTDVGCPTNLRFVPEGATLPFSPEWTINAGVQYTFMLGNVDVTPRVQWSHLSSQIATPFPSANTIVPGRDLFDARITFDLGESYKLEAFANNITNKTYIASQIQNSSSADGGIIYGAPRTIGLRVKVEFGG
ncbi:TonB-dependent receptor [Altererythrobacter sp. KTW20L]|uniref:TonB-dependent receptor n=1 Tax=Altererythrobacter sp. KTW20L TaxID=2942210 RepID=UPI0020C0C2EE|nr:TonB-dependent receptor [Altererythrobacter sp. KTW20L]MCL6251611.1 TonB-dependent receptor [Altererythrobacter sp. KTW20L]